MTTKWETTPLLYWKERMRRIKNTSYISSQAFTDTKNVTQATFYTLDVWKVKVQFQHPRGTPSLQVLGETTDGILLSSGMTSHGHEARRKNAKNTGTSWLRLTTGRSLKATEASCPQRFSRARSGTTRDSSRRNVPVFQCILWGNSLADTSWPADPLRYLLSPRASVCTDFRAI